MKSRVIRKAMPSARSLLVASSLSVALMSASVLFPDVTAEAQELTYTLSAVVQTGADERIAYVVDQGTGYLLTVRVGDMLGAWTVDAIDDQHVRVVRAEQSAVIGFATEAEPGSPQAVARTRAPTGDAVTPQRAREIEQAFQEKVANHTAAEQELRTLYLEDRENPEILSLLRQGWPGPVVEVPRLKALYESNPDDPEIVWLLEHGWNPEFLR